MLRQSTNTLMTASLSVVAKLLIVNQMSKGDPQTRPKQVLCFI